MESRRVRNSTGICRVVVFKEEDSFVAQCLEYDICTFASDMRTLRERFLSIFSAELVMSSTNGEEPFAGIEPAPDKFFDMWPRLDDDPQRIIYANGSCLMAKAA